MVSDALERPVKCRTRTAGQTQHVEHRLLSGCRQYRVLTGGSEYFAPNDGLRRPAAYMSENNIVADALWWMV